MKIKLPDIVDLIDYTVPFLRTSVIYKDCNRTAHFTMPPKHCHSENPLRRNDDIMNMVATANNVLQNDNVVIESIKNILNGNQQCLQINLARSFPNG